MAKSNKRYGVDLNIAGETEAAVDVPQEFVGPVAAGWGAIATAIPLVLFVALGEISGLLFEDDQKTDGVSAFLVQFAIFPFFVFLFSMWIFCFFGPAIALFTWGVKLTNAKRGIFDMLAWVLALWLILAWGFWSASIDVYYFPDFLSIPVIIAVTTPFFALGGFVYHRKQQKMNRALDAQEGPLDIT
jgi:hypothetical protein